MNNRGYSLKRTARFAGFLSFVMGIPVPFSLLYVPSKIVVAGNTAATANNILSMEFLFRAGILAHLFSALVFLLLSLVLYRLFKHVDEYLAKLLVALVIVQVPIIFVLEAINFSALMIMKGEVLNTIQSEIKQDVAVLLIKMHRYGISLLQIFWGLWLFPYGALINKAGFIPRILGILLIINGMGYIIESLSFLLLQKSNYLMIRQFTFITYFGEVAIMLWLLIKGVKDNAPGVELPASQYSTS